MTLGALLIATSVASAARVDWSWVDECGARLSRHARAAARAGRPLVVDQRGTRLDPRVIMDLERTLGGKFLTFASAGVFLPQVDRLVEEIDQLGRRGNGTCTTMCMINALWTVRRYFRHGLAEYPDFGAFVADVLPEIDHDAAIMREDIARGLSLEHVPALLEQRLARVGLRGLFKYQTFGPGPALNKAIERHGLWIAVFNEDWGRDRIGHAVVILRHDRTAQTLVISDPNRPNTPLEAGYTLHRRKRRVVLRIEPGLPDSEMHRNVILTRVIDVQLRDGAPADWD